MKTISEKDMEHKAAMKEKKKLAKAIVKRKGQLMEEAVNTSEFSKPSMRAIWSQLSREFGKHESRLRYIVREAGLK